MACLRTVYEHTAFTKFRDDPVSERSQCSLVRVARREISRQGHSADTHRSCAMGFQKEQVDAESGIDAVQCFAEKAQDMRRVADRPGSSDGQAGQVSIRLEGVEGKTARALAKATKISAKGFRELPEPVRHAIAAGDGLRAWQPGGMCRRRQSWPQGLKAQAERLIEPEANCI